MRVPIRIGPLLVALLSGLGAAACATASGGDNPFAGGGDGAAASIRIEVQNLNFNDATLHALSSGRRHRLGTVSGKSNETFRIPWESQESLRVEIDLLAAGSHTTGPVSVAPRDRVQLVIQPELRRSYIQR